MSTTPPLVEDWKQTLGALPQPDGVSHYEVIANHILYSLVAGTYRSSKEVRWRDVKQLAAALEALVQLELAAVTVEGNR
jgi:hypothetical protein